jgi:ribosomal protein S20
MDEIGVRFPLPAPSIYFMPNTRSAKKANRSSLKKRGYNKARSFKVKEALKGVRVAGNDSVSLTTAISNAFSALDKAVKTKLMPKGRADRKKSKLSVLLAGGEAKVASKVVKKSASKIATANKAKAVKKAKNAK